MSRTWSSSRRMLKASLSCPLFTIGTTCPHQRSQVIISHTLVDARVFRSIRGTSLRSSDVWTLACRKLPSTALCSRSERRAEEEAEEGRERERRLPPHKQLLRERGAWTHVHSRSQVTISLQGYLAHKKLPPPLKPKGRPMPKPLWWS